uniref:V-SNARE coiled-coil homology domain-containing protein n=1 Tax=Branchiostoma floridae TaxID=7739 RepID=C3YCU5_BRAFL|eukprot:XP_002605886.1 hypothetical protein BRAFLDRAFT_87442 [Branchiostoma floridae]
MCKALYTLPYPDSVQEVSSGEMCVICDATLEKSGRDKIPSCRLVERTSALWLRNYRLGNLTSSDVSHLRHLRKLYIEPVITQPFNILLFICDLLHLDNSTFDGFHLYNLSLSHNKLSYVGKRWFKGVKGHLSLSHNEIAYIEDEAFGTSDRCLDIVALHLPWNKLTVIKPGYFRHLCELAFLDLRYNRIRVVEENSFNTLHRLRVLCLAGNKLKAVRTTWFPAIQEERLLSTLDLAQNEIQYIEPGAFRFLPHIGDINLTDNRIASLQENQLKIEDSSFDIWKFVELRVVGNPLRCTCALRWLMKSCHSQTKDLRLLTCSYPGGLQGRNLCEFTSTMAASLPCPAPRLTVSALDGARTFRCEGCWEVEPPHVKWTLPDGNDVVITDMSFETETHVNYGDVNITTSLYMDPDGFTCCHSETLYANRSTLSNSSCNYVRKTVSFLTVSEILMQKWHGEVISCTALFPSDEALNVTAHYKVTSFSAVPDASTSGTETLTEAGEGKHHVVFLLNSDNNVSINPLDLIITALLTSSVVALSCFVAFALCNHNTFKKPQENSNDCHTENQHGTDQFSHHTYETVEDQPQPVHQYDVIPDHQNADDIITPYGQASMSGAYASHPTSQRVATMVELDSLRSDIKTLVGTNTALKNQVQTMLNEAKDDFERKSDEAMMKREVEMKIMEERLVSITAEREIFKMIATTTHSDGQSDTVSNNSYRDSERKRRDATFPHNDGQSDTVSNNRRDDTFPHNNGQSDTVSNNRRDDTFPHNDGQSDTVSNNRRDDTFPHNDGQSDTVSNNRRDDTFPHNDGQSDTVSNNRRDDTFPHNDGQSDTVSNRRDDTFPHNDGQSDTVSNNRRDDTFPHNDGQSDTVSNNRKYDTFPHNDGQSDTVSNNRRDDTFPHNDGQSDKVSNNRRDDTFPHNDGQSDQTAMQKAALSDAPSNSFRQSSLRKDQMRAVSCSYAHATVQWNSGSVCEPQPECDENRAGARFITRGIVSHDSIGSPSPCALRIQVKRIAPDRFPSLREQSHPVRFSANRLPEPSSSDTVSNNRKYDTFPHNDGQSDTVSNNRRDDTFPHNDGQSDTVSNNRRDDTFPHNDGQSDTVSNNRRDDTFPHNDGQSDTVSNNRKYDTFPHNDGQSEMYEYNEIRASATIPHGRERVPEARRNDHKGRIMQDTLFSMKAEREIFKPKPTIEDLQWEVEEAQNIMRSNVEKLVNEREERLENVLGRSEKLHDAAGSFARVSRRARVRIWLRSNKWTICIICTAVVLILCAVVTVIVLKSKGVI